MLELGELARQLGRRAGAGVRLQQLAGDCGGVATAAEEVEALVDGGEALALLLGARGGRGRRAVEPALVRALGTAVTLEVLLQLLAVLLFCLALAHAGLAGGLAHEHLAGRAVERDGEGDRLVGAPVAPAGAVAGGGHHDILDAGCHRWGFGDGQAERCGRPAKKSHCAGAMSSHWACA